MMKFRDLKSLLVDHLILWRSYLHRVECVFGWRSLQKSRSKDGVLVLLSTFSYGFPRASSHWDASRNIRVPRIKHSSLRCRSRSKQTSKNVSRYFLRIPCVRSQALIAAHHSSQFSTRILGMTQVDWERGRIFHCEEIRHLENPWNHSYNWDHFAIPVFLPWALIVSRFSINLLRENSSTRNSWTLYNSSIPSIPLIRVSRCALSCTANSSK